MATTQKNSGGKNAVLKPLNLVARSVRGNTSTDVATPERPVIITRRTRRQVTAARVQHELEQANKAQKRAESMAERVKRAEARAAEKRAEAERIQQEAEQREREEREAAARAEAERASIAKDSVSGSKTVPAVAMTPEIEANIGKITKDFNRFFGELEAKYGVKFTFASTDTVPGEPTLVKRGFISARLRGDLPVEKRAVQQPASDLSVHRSEARFMKFYREVGLNPSWLNKEVRVKDDPNTYIVSGLRGKAHAIVLRRKDTGDIFTVPHEDFKKLLDKSVA